MPKVKPEGEPGTKTVMVTAEPGLSKEQIESAAKSLPEIKEDDNATYNVVNALRDVALNASIEEAELKNLEVKSDKKEATKMAAEEKKTNNNEEVITDEMRELADKIARKNIKELMKLDEESKDEKSFIDRVKENWDVCLAVAALIVAIYFAYKHLLSSNDSMAQDAVTAGLELALDD